MNLKKMMPFVTSAVAVVFFCFSVAVFAHAAGDAAAEKGISFPYPQQDVHMYQQAAD